MTSNSKHWSPSTLHRLSVTSRLLAAVIGGYLLAAAIRLFIGLTLPIIVSRMIGS